MSESAAWLSVFPVVCLYRQPDGTKPVIDRWGPLRLVQDLLQRGLSSGEAVVFVSLVLMAGESLSNPISLARLGRIVGKRRDHVAQVVTRLLEMGVIGRSAPLPDKSRVYTFLSHAEVETRYPRRGTPDESRNPLFPRKSGRPESGAAVP